MQSAIYDVSTDGRLLFSREDVRILTMGGFDGGQTERIFLVRVDGAVHKRDRPHRDQSGDRDVRQKRPDVPHVLNNR